jgi:hypothetical protein
MNFVILLAVSAMLFILLLFVGVRVGYRAKSKQEK